MNKMFVDKGRSICEVTFGYCARDYGEVGQLVAITAVAVVLLIALCTATIRGI